MFDRRDVLVEPPRPRRCFTNRAAMFYQPRRTMFDRDRRDHDPPATTPRRRVCRRHDHDAAARDFRADRTPAAAPHAVRGRPRPASSAPAQRVTPPAPCCVAAVSLPRR